jgi:hypothetical protein
MVTQEPDMDFFYKADNSSDSVIEGLRAISEQPQPSEAKTTFDPAIALQDALVDLSKSLQPPPVCLSIIQKGQAATIGTLGNFSMIIGKAKSRKTFFITIAIAAATKNDLVLGQFKGSLPIGQHNVLFFDTEQGDYHVQLATKRICSISGQQSPENLLVYGLRKYKPSERLKMIEYAINTIPDIGLIVIDGIKDLVTSINDEEQATSIASFLLKWSEEKNIHIIVVLHQNKGDQNARGHLGTELQNKAETVLSITKDSECNDISIVQAEYCRDRDPEPFAFEIDGNGLPVLSENWEIKSSKTEATNFSPAKFGEDWHKANLKDVFKDDRKLKHGELITELRLQFQGLNKQIGDNKAKEFIRYYLNEEMIKKEGKDRSPTSLYYLSL